MKKHALLKSLIREEIRKILKEEDTPTIDTKIDTAIDNKAAELVKPGSEAYKKLDSTLLPKLQQMSPEDLKKFIGAVTTGMKTLGVDPGDTITRQTIDSSTKKSEVQKAADTAVKEIPLKEWTSLSEGAKIAGLAAAAGDIMGAIGKLNLVLFGIPGGLLSAGLMSVIPGNQSPDATLAGAIAAAAASGGMIMLGNWLNSDKVQNALASKGVTKVSENSMRAKLRNEISKALREDFSTGEQLPMSLDPEQKMIDDKTKEYERTLGAKLTKKPGQDSKTVVQYTWAGKDGKPMVTIDKKKNDSSNNSWFYRIQVGKEPVQQIPANSTNMEAQLKKALEKLDAMVGSVNVSENSLRMQIRNEIRKAIKEEDAVEVPKSVETADSEMAKLAKLVKKLPDDLKAKLAKKVKAAQGDVSSYIDDIKSKDDKKD